MRRWTDLINKHKHTPITLGEAHRLIRINREKEVKKQTALEEVTGMLIQVKYPNNTFDFVKVNILDNLIESGAVVEFKRTSGWVSIGVDQIRTVKRE